MTENIDLATITDINVLKAMAYDQVAMAQQAQANLQQIEARIAQVQSTGPIEMNGVAPNREQRRAAAKKI